MSILEANGQQLEVKKGDTILQALKRGGIHVPTICHMEGLLPVRDLPHVRGGGGRA